jgi:hypothetical protein
VTEELPDLRGKLGGSRVNRGGAINVPKSRLASAKRQQSERQHLPWLPRSSRLVNPPSDLPKQGLSGARDTQKRQVGSVFICFYGLVHVFALFYAMRFPISLPAARQARCPFQAPPDGAARMAFVLP